MNRGVQSLRGLACLMLVAYHVVGADPQRGLRLADGLLRSGSDLLALVRMPLFALLAGAMYARRPRADLASLRDKAARLLLPMLTVGTLFALMQSEVPGTRHQVSDLRLLHVVPVAHFWFLESLFLVFCVVFVLERAGWLKRPAGMAAIALASCAIYLSHPGFIWFGVAGAAYLLPYFLAGYALVCHGGQRHTNTPWAALALAVTGLLGLVAGAMPVPGMDRYTWPALITGVCWSAALWLRPPQARWLASLGDRSYAIFLYHAFFTAAARIGLERAGVHDLAVHLVAGTLAGLAGPILVHRLLSPSPLARAWLLGEPARAAAAPTAPSTPDSTRTATLRGSRP